MRTINHRQKQKTMLKTSVIITSILILTLSVAYAALSETLTISGTGKVTASNWDIKLNNSASKQNETTGSATYTSPVVNGTTISYSVGLTKPSDSVTLYFDLSNFGDVVGEISSIVSSAPICTSTTGNTADENLVCNNLETTLVYSDGTTIQVGDILNNDGKVCSNGSTYWKTTTPSIQVLVKLKDSMTTLPTSEVNITNLKHDIIYTQTEKTCTDKPSCFVEGTKIAVANGYKNIEDIKIGDYVYSYNLDTKTKELKQVKNTFKNEVNELYTIKLNNEEIKTTEMHPFYDINKGWIKVKDLDFDSKLLSLKNGPTNIKHISKKNTKVYVYNFEVEDYHNYLITEEEILVHNVKVYGGVGSN